MRNKIYVVSYGIYWKVRCDHCESKVINTQYEAIKIAKNHVSDLPEGILSQIIIQKSDGTFREEWTYGKDPFPPRG